MPSNIGKRHSCNLSVNISLPCVLGIATLSVFTTGGCSHNLHVVKVHANDDLRTVTPSSWAASLRYTATNQAPLTSGWSGNSASGLKTYAQQILDAPPAMQCLALEGADSWLSAWGHSIPNPAFPRQRADANGLDGPRYALAPIQDFDGNNDLKHEGIQAACSPRISAAAAAGLHMCSQGPCQENKSDGKRDSGLGVVVTEAKPAAQAVQQKTGLSKSAYGRHVGTRLELAPSRTLGTKALARAETVPAPAMPVIPIVSAVEPSVFAASISGCAGQPLAPADVALASERDGIIVTWDRRAYCEQYFRIERSMAGKSAWDVLAVLPKDSKNYRDQSRKPLTEYRYRVVSVSANGESASAAVLLSPLSPSAPTDLTVSKIHGSAVKLKWVDNAVDEHHYMVERSDRAVHAWVTLSDFLPPNSTIFIDTSVDASRPYKYRVTAVSQSGKAVSEVVIAPASVAVAATLPEKHMHNSPADGVGKPMSAR